MADSGKSGEQNAHQALLNVVHTQLACSPITRQKASNEVFAMSRQCPGPGRVELAIVELGLEEE
ncbi:uncharacterized protein TrAFT101_002800 [Trichoderma asperellum]|uniref:uncharacterized protein n=1 Tax=Trichoderma asperellum TaxID=101201 RepID=UPI00331746EE|nr:hypothetical protein TrAFT101_002800 [Trichoderma asperellum]